MTTELVRLSFGKYNGELITRVPPNYLTYMIQNGTPLAKEAKAELERRGTTLPTIDITGHAIDRCSQRFLGLWVGDRRENEGLHSWLARIAREALDSAIVPSETVVYKGIRFVFDLSLAAPQLKTVMNGKKEEAN